MKTTWWAIRRMFVGGSELLFKDRSFNDNGIDGNQQACEPPRAESTGPEDSAEAVVSFAEIASEIESEDFTLSGRQPIVIVLSAPDGWFDPDLAESLRLMNCEVHEATNALDAARLAAVEEAGLIVADLHTCLNRSLLEMRRTLRSECKLVACSDWGSELMTSGYGYNLVDGCVSSQCTARELRSMCENLLRCERLC